MNSKIMIGAGIALLAWGAVSIAYDKGATGAALIAVGVAFMAIGFNQSRKK